LAASLVCLLLPGASAVVPLAFLLNTLKEQHPQVSSIQNCTTLRKEKKEKKLQKEKKNAGTFDFYSEWTIDKHKAFGWCS